jgi:4a-hydroxytetrahydrobiopterin dehydratase
MRITVADLANKKCIPCQGGIQPLSKEEAQRKLEHIQGWVLIDQGKKLFRHFPFKNFKTAFAFAKEVAEIAENEQHHPDVLIGWGYCDVTIFTHKIGGLHENDFIIAAKINLLFF